MDSFGEIIAEERRHYSFEWWTNDILVTSNEDSWTSPTLNFLDETWHLIFKKSETNKRCLNLQLSRDTRCPLDLSVCVILGLKTRNGKLLKSMSVTHLFTIKDCNLFWALAVERKEFVCKRCKLCSKRELCPNGVIVVSCELRLNEKSSEDAESQTPPHDDTATLVQNLLEIFEYQKMCDVTICVRDQKLEAHSSILAARSVAFASLFDQDMTQQKNGVIKIDDFDPLDVNDFLLYLYSANVNIISSENVFALYSIADKYKVSPLTSSCEQFLLTNLSVKLICDTLVLAIKYDASTLLKAAEDFFGKHSQEIMGTAKWKHFEEENKNAASALCIKNASKL